MTPCRKPVVLGAGVALLAATALVAACGGPSSDGSGPPGRDAAVPEGGSGSPDVLEATAPLDAGAEPDAFATGQHLVPRPSRFEGLTSDGYVVFSELTDAGGRMAEVIGLDGGGETTIATGTDTNATALVVQVSGPVVFAWTDRGSGVSTLTLWSSATGVVTKGGGIRPNQGAASSDGAYVGYVTHPSTDVANIVFGPIASTSTTTIGQINVPNTDCWQNNALAFVGTTSPRFVSFFCPNGSSSFTIRSVDPSIAGDAGTVDLTTTAVAESFGQNVVLFQDTTGLLESVQPDGTGAVTLASNAAAFALSEDQSSVVFQTTDQSVVTSPIASAFPRVAAPPGMGAEIGPLSPDKSRVLFASTLADGGADQIALYTDVQLATFTGDGGDDAGATVRALVPSPTSCPACLNDSFTPDSTYAMALDPIDNSQSAGGTGPLHVFPLDGGADWRIGTNVYTVIALGTGAGAASQFLFVAATPDSALANGFAFELYSRSLAASDTPNEIGRDVEAAGLDDALTTVVYSIPGDGDLAGVWAAPLP
jgi:hypothetical protein